MEGTRACRKCHLLLSRPLEWTRLAADHLLTASGLLKTRVVDKPCGSVRDPLEGCQCRAEWDPWMETPGLMS